MTPQLDALIAQFHAASRRLHALTDTLPHDRWNARATPASWSVAECVAHLNLTSAAYEPRFTQALVDARALGPRNGKALKMDVPGRILSALIGPMLRIGGWKFGRMPTTPAFVPSGDQPKDAVMSEFDARTAFMVQFLGSAQELPIDRVRISSPFNEKMKYSLWSALLILPRHAQRHIEQAENVWHGR
ncbi:MAG: DinB-like domain protein [Gemmatimonadetes bacterium]|nr:DinB-like domain protein [Gemmatimonadota bacterium]